MEQYQFRGMFFVLFLFLFRLSCMQASVCGMLKLGFGVLKLG